MDCSLPNFGKAKMKAVMQCLLDLHMSAIQLKYKVYYFDK